MLCVKRDKGVEEYADGLQRSILWIFLVAAKLEKNFGKKWSDGLASSSGDWFNVIDYSRNENIAEIWTCL